jgi:hypothetical protein
LRGDGADTGLCPDHTVADGEHARLHGRANLSGFRIKTENRERARRIVWNQTILPWDLHGPRHGDRQRGQRRTDQRQSNAHHDTRPFTALRAAG